jgi:hypothetical protein
MDHHPEPLDALLDRFLRSKGLSISVIRTVPEGEGLVAMERHDLKQEWMAFHRREAILKPAHRDCNRPGARR